MKKVYMLYMNKPTVHDYIEKQHEEVTQLFNKYEGNYIIHHEGKNAPYGSEVVALDSPVQEYDFNIIHFEGTAENENEIRLQTPNGEDIIATQQQILAFLKKNKSLELIVFSGCLNKGLLKLLIQNKITPIVGTEAKDKLEYQFQNRLITSFYTNYLHGLPFVEAFRKANTHGNRYGLNAISSTQGNWYKGSGLYVYRKRSFLNQIGKGAKNFWLTFAAIATLLGVISDWGDASSSIMNTISGWVGMPIDVAGVLKDGSKTPVEDAVIMLGDYAFTTSKDGKFKFPNIQNGIDSMDLMVIYKGDTLARRRILPSTQKFPLQLSQIFAKRREEKVAPQREIRKRVNTDVNAETSLPTAEEIKANKPINPSTPQKVKISDIPKEVVEKAKENVKETAKPTKSVPSMSNKRYSELEEIGFYESMEVRKASVKSQNNWLRVSFYLASLQKLNQRKPRKLTIDDKVTAKVSVYRLPSNVKIKDKKLGSIITKVFNANESPKITIYNSDLDLIGTDKYRFTGVRVHVELVDPNGKTFLKDDFRFDYRDRGGKRVFD